MGQLMSRLMILLKRNPSNRSQLEGVGVSFRTYDWPPKLGKHIL